MAVPKLVGLTGNVRTPSRTAALAGIILDAVGARIGAETETIDLGISGPVLMRAPMADTLDDEGRALIETIQSADALVVASPVYRASYTGALKHVFDLVHLDALAGKPVLLAATGGTPMHALMLEHQFRPLFGFFRAITLPTTIYALESDFEAYRLTNPAVVDRIARAGDDMAAILSAGPALRPEVSLPHQLPIRRRAL